MLQALEDEILVAPPKLTISEWADRHRMLSRESSAEPGQWRTDRAPYQRGVMDAFSDPEIETVVFMKSAQVGATEILNNVVGFHVDRDPSPIMVIQPNVKPMAEAWSKDRLAPMLRDTPTLRGKVTDPRSRNSNNTITHKVFPGGHITVVGANSPAGLASRPIRILLGDEIDRFPESAGSEGDPVELAIQRTQTFWNRKIGLFSTPTIKDLSRIEKAWKQSDQRRYFVPCPQCGALQTLEWKQIQFSHDNHIVDPDSVYYLCQECDGMIDELDKPAMIDAGEWVSGATAPGIAGFHINALYSPWKSWPKIAQEFLDVKDDRERLKVWVNTTLAEPWEDRGEKINPEQFEARAEAYVSEVPAGVGVLTAAVDVQLDRLELEVVGWGAGEESWRIAHHRIYGDPDSEDPWQRLEALLAKPYEHELGATIRIRATMIDSGYKTVSVYNFVRPRQARNVWATKGVDGYGKSPLSRSTRANRDGVKLFTVGTMQLKDQLFSRLRLTHPGPRWMHFRKQHAFDNGFDAEFYAQFGAEKVVVERKGGRRHRTYVQIRDRNEAIDLEVLNLAALHALGAGVRNHLEKWVTKLRETGMQQTAEAGQPTDPDTPPTVTRQRKRKRGRSWVQDY